MDYSLLLGVHFCARALATQGLGAQNFEDAYDASGAPPNGC
jgi:hypothetical protein